MANYPPAIRFCLVRPMLGACPTRQNGGGKGFADHADSFILRTSPAPRAEIGNTAR